MTETRRIRVLIADDHLVVRYGLKSIVDQQDDMQVVAEASNGSQAVELFREHRPDVMLIDLRMPGLTGDEVITTVRREAPGARVIVLTIHKGDEAVYRAVRAGARGYFLKDVPFPVLLDAIRRVHGGERVLPAEVADKMADRLQQEILSAREVDVLKLIAGGCSNRQIGERLGMSENGVKRYVTALLEKLGAQDRTHAVTLALDRNVIHLDEVDLRRRPPES